jgi:hypothetical protein
VSARTFAKLGVALALVAAVSPTPAQAGDNPFAELLESASINLSPTPASSGVPTAPPPAHVTPLDLAAIPEQEIPAPLDPSLAPARVPQDAPAAALRLANVTRFQLARFRANRDSLDVQIESAQGGIGAGAFTRAGSTITPATKLSTSCRKDAAVQGLRWEQAHLSDKGELTIDIDDGWFDPQNCTLSIERRTTLHPVSVPIEPALPFAFALRSDAGLTLFFVPGTNLAADGSGELRQGNGALMRVTVPLRRGAAASVLASASATRLAGWRLQAMGREVPSSASAGDVAITLGVDALQTVSDAQPSVLVRSFEQVVGQGTTLSSPRRFFPMKMMRK